MNARNRAAVLFVVTLAGLFGLLVYQNVFPYQTLKSRAISGLNYDSRSPDRAIFGRKEFIEDSHSAINRLNVALDFKAFSVNGTATIVQTAPHNHGVSLVLDKTGTLTLIAGTEYAPGFKEYIISGGILPGTWHHFSLTISPSKRIVIRFDDGPVVDAPDTELVTDISDIIVGGGGDPAGAFDGEIRDGSIGYQLYARAAFTRSPLPRILELLLFGLNLVALYWSSGIVQRERECEHLTEAKI